MLYCVQVGYKRSVGRRRMSNLMERKTDDEYRREGEMTCARCAKKMSRCGGRFEGRGEGLTNLL